MPGNRPRRRHRAVTGGLWVVDHLAHGLGSLGSLVEFELEPCARDQGPRVRIGRHGVGWHHHPDRAYRDHDRRRHGVDPRHAGHPGQLTNVVVGDCVVVRPTKDGGSPPTVTAASVQFGAADNGRCGRAGGWGTKAVVGTVASITGSTVAVTGADNAKATQGAGAERPGDVTVTVTPTTRYASRSKATPAVIAVGHSIAG